MLLYLTLFSLWCSLLLGNAVRAEPVRVQLLLSEQSGPYLQFEAALRQRLAAHAAKIQLSLNANADTELRLTVGVAATESVSGSAPVLAVMLPQASYQILSERNKWPHFSAIYLDQPWSRQFHLLLTLFPQLNQAGVLYSPERFDIVDQLTPEAAKHRIEVLSRKVTQSTDLFPALENLLPRVDVLLATPDKAIFNKNQVRNILLTSYRYKKPLLGLSESWVTAGALAAVYSTPEQLAEQTVTTLLSFAETGKLAPPQYPKQFQIAINQQVARSLGLPFDSAEQLRRSVLLRELPP